MKNSLSFHDNIRHMIYEQFMKTLNNIEFSEEVEKSLRLWMENEINRLIVNTQPIPKQDVRIKSIVLMFQKKFEQVSRLIHILKNHDLLTNEDLFNEIMSIL